jgi:hypothetical protein
VDLVRAQPESPVQLLGQVDRQLATAKVTAVARNDGLGSHLPGGLVEDGILEVGEPKVHRRGEDRSVDGRDLEDSQKLADLADRSLVSYFLAQEVVEGRECRGAEIAVDLARLRPGKGLAGCVGEGSSVEEQVQDDVGVEEDPQRYFSSRYR